jgi:hypothetical protein
MCNSLFILTIITEVSTVHHLTKSIHIPSIMVRVRIVIPIINNIKSFRFNIFIGCFIIKLSKFPDVNEAKFFISKAKLGLFNIIIYSILGASWCKFMFVTTCRYRRCFLPKARFKLVFFFNLVNKEFCKYTSSGRVITLFIYLTCCLDIYISLILKICDPEARVTAIRNYDKGFLRIIT